jgi:ribonuclease Z
MSVRELVVLGTASQAPTRARNHNGYLLRWDGEGFLFDPGEGTQRQLAHAGIAATDITRLCLTHFHGDHCLGVPASSSGSRSTGCLTPYRRTIRRRAPDYFARLRHATIFHETADVREEPITGEGVIATGAFGTLTALRLDHPVETYGTAWSNPTAAGCCPRSSRSTASAAHSSASCSASAGWTWPDAL